jgi:hypothetical protein
MSEFQKKNCEICNKEFFAYKPTETLGYEPETLCNACNQKEIEKSSEEISVNK